MHFADKHKLFISYSRHDGSLIAEELEGRLWENNFKTLRDTRDINPYKDFTAEIEKMIEQSSCVLVCITPDSRRDNSFVRREIQYSKIIGKPIIPLRFSDVVPPLSIINNEWVDFFPDYSKAFQRLMTVLSRPIDSSLEAAASSNDPFQEYLEFLFLNCVNFLKQTVLSHIDLTVKEAEGITLHRAQEQPDIFQQLFWGQSILHTDQEKKGFLKFDDAFEFYNKRILLLGNPGAGKTITLIAMAREAVSKRMNDIDMPLPLLGLVPSWDPIAITPFSTWLANGLKKITAPQIENLIRQGRALLLLDALDELGEERSVEEWKDGKIIVKRFDPRALFLQFIPANNEILLTCRIKDYLDIKRSVNLNGCVELQPLNDSQIKAYLRDMPILLELIEQDELLKSILRTPLLMSIFSFSFKNLSIEEQLKLKEFNKGPGHLRDEIVKTFVYDRFNWENRKHKLSIPATAFFEFLSKIALADASSNWGRNNITYDDVEAVSKTQANEFIDQALKLNLFIKYTILKKARLYDEYKLHDEFKFCHLIFRDYFAFQLATHSIGTPLEHTAILAIANIPETRAAKKLISFLATPNIENRVTCIIKIIVRLKDIPDEDLSGALLDNNPTIREAMAEACYLMPYKSSLVPVLITLLTDKAPVVRGVAARALASWKETGVLSAIVSLLQDACDTTRANAVYAVSALGQKTEICFLEPLLSDECPLVRLNAEFGIMKLNKK